jgi:hypothetical protein
MCCEESSAKGDFSGVESVDIDKSVKPIDITSVAGAWAKTRVAIHFPLLLETLVALGSVALAAIQRKGKWEGIV